MGGLSLNALAAFFVFAGAMHFKNPRFYTKIIPPMLPFPKLINYLSGAAEIAIGLLLLCPHLRVRAAWAAIALLVAVFPANVYAAVQGIEGYGGWYRLPMQLPLIYWAYTHTDP